MEVHNLGACHRIYSAKSKLSSGKIDRGRPSNVPLVKKIDLEFIASTYRSSPTSLSEARAPQLAPCLLGVFCGLFGAVFVAVQIVDCEVGFLAGVDG